VTLGQRGQPPTHPPHRTRWGLRARAARIARSRATEVTQRPSGGLDLVLKSFFALQHLLCGALALCVRALRLTRNTGEELPFQLALTLELTWLRPEQRYQLEACGSPTNIVDFSSYYPDRALRSRRTPTPVPTRLRWHWSTACVVTTLFLGLTPLLLAWIGPRSGEYSTDMGEHRSIALTDGSTVVMTAQSHMRVRFSARGRDIELLQGEALFSVAPDGKRPFRVHAGQTILETVGTGFSVVNLADGGTRVGVTRGQVQVFARPQQGSILLNPYGLAWTGMTMFGSAPPPAGIVISAGHEARASWDRYTLEVESRAVPVAELERHTAWTNGLLAAEPH
jgi:ferric-dicitrate binding protein FerR (iron transport regulator)